MPEKKFKYNSVCKKDVHTNNPYFFAKHVFSCPECQKGLPPDILEKIKSYMDKMKATKDNKQKSVKIPQKEKQAKPVKNVQKEIVKSAIPSKSPEPLKVSTPEPVPKINPEILNEVIQKIPVIARLAATVKVVSDNNQKFSTKVNNDVGKLSTEVGALKDGFTGLGGAIKILTQKMIEQQTSPNVFGGEKPATEEPDKNPEIMENKIPAPQAEKISAPEVKKTPESQGTIASGGGKLPDLSPQEAKEMETYLAQQKAKLGQGAGGPGSGGPVGAINPIIGGVKDTVREIRGLIDAFSGRGGEAQAMPRTTEELATQVLLNTVKAAGDKKDPIEYLVKGMELSNTNLGNTIKLLTGKNPITGEVKGGGISADDIRNIIREEIGGRGGSEESVE